jgi:hypothetical protein
MTSLLLLLLLRQLHQLSGENFGISLQTDTLATKAVEEYSFFLLCNRFHECTHYSGFIVICAPMLSSE